MRFGQHQDTELWNNQFPEFKILGVPVSRRMRAMVYMVSRDKVDVGAFHKGIQYALEKLGKPKFGFERTAVSNFKSKRHEGSGNELVDYSRAIGHVRYINILAWLRGFRVKIANFSSFFCLSIPKGDLDTKKATPNIEV